MECLVSGSRESGFDVWDVNTAANLLSINNAKVSAAHNATAITTTAQGKLQLLSTDIKKPYIHISTFTLASHSSNTTSSSSLPSHLSALALSPSTHYLLAASSTSPSLHLFSLSTTPPSLAATFSSHYRPPTCVAWSADERFVISGGEDGCVNVHALTDLLRDEHTDVERLLRQHASQQSASSPASSGAWVSFASHSLGVVGVVCGGLSYQSLVFSASLDHSVHVHSLVTRTTVQRFVLPCALTSLVVLRTGTAVLAGGSDGAVYYQPLITSAVKAATTTTNTAASPSTVTYSTLSGHSGAINALAVSSTSSLLASASADGSIRLWDLHTLHCIRTINKPSRPPYTHLAFTHTTPTPNATTTADWSTLRGTRSHAASANLTPTPSHRPTQHRVSGSRRIAEVEAEWRAVCGEGEVSELRRVVVEERRKREAVEAELEQWKAVNRAMYRKIAAKLLSEVKQTDSKSDSTDEPAAAAARKQAKESDEREQQEEEDEDEVQILSETMEDADESMEEDVVDDDSGGLVITVE